MTESYASPELEELGYVYEQLHPPAVSPDALIRQARGTAWVEIGAEVVVYRAADATSYVLSKVAGLVWQCLDGESSLREICTDLAQVFEISVEQVIDDFLPIVAQWLMGSIVEEVSNGEGLASAR